jgi:hypothetical protein
MFRSNREAFGFFSKIVGLLILEGFVIYVLVGDGYIVRLAHALVGGI